MPAEKVGAQMSPGGRDFPLLPNTLCQKIPALVDLGENCTKLLVQGIFILSVKSQHLEVALINFVLKAE